MSSSRVTAGRRALVTGRSSERWVRLSQVWRALRRPGNVLSVLNARLRLGGRARTPLTVRLAGRASAGGGGRIVLGERMRIIGDTVPVEFVAQPGARLAIGARTSVNYGVSVTAAAAVTVGRECNLGQYVIIDDRTNYTSTVESGTIAAPAPVVLEDHVWLGARVVVLSGVRIGHDAVVSAGSVVTHDLPPRSVSAGIPARVIQRF